MKNSLLVICFIFGITACQKAVETGLKDQFQDDFFIRAAVNLGQVNGTELGADSLLSLHLRSIRTRSAG